MPLGVANLAYGLTKSSISATQTEIEIVADGGVADRFPPAPFDAILGRAYDDEGHVDGEIVTVTAVNGETVTVTRASRPGSGSAFAWLAGTPFEAVLSKETLDELSSGSGGGAADHGGLSGLADDDHPQYFLADGTRALAGNLSAGGHKITGLAAAITNGEAVRFEQLTDLSDSLSTVATTGDYGDLANTPDLSSSAVAALYESEPNVNRFTDAEKSKLAGLESSHFRGLYGTLSALQEAHGTANAGDYAHVDAGASSDVQVYAWDPTDNAWTLLNGTTAGPTSAEVKTLYEANADTNAYSDAERDKVANLPANTATALAGKANTSHTQPFTSITGAVADSQIPASAVSQHVGTAAVSNSYADLDDRPDLTTVVRTDTANSFTAPQRSAQQAIPFAASLTVDASAASNQVVITLSGDVTSFAVSNLAPGQVIAVEFVQDATGGRSVIHSGLTGDAPTIDDTADAITVVQYRGFSDSSWRVV